MPDVTYRIGNDLDPAQFVELLKATSLGVRRPVDDLQTIRNMLQHGNLTVSAWDGSLLVGVARSLTDFSFVAYLSDLAVRETHQKCGIGRELIRLTRSKLGAATKLVLLSAPAAVEYYPQLGFTQHPSAWTIDAHEPLL
jgi:predicted N-acetyltransferase YhbS